MQIYAACTAAVTERGDVTCGLSGSTDRRSVRALLDIGSCKRAHGRSMARRVRRESPESGKQEPALDLRAHHRREPHRFAVVGASTALDELDLASRQLGHSRAARGFDLLLRDVAVARYRHAAVRRDCRAVHCGTECAAVAALDR